MSSFEHNKQELRQVKRELRAATRELRAATGQEKRKELKKRKKTLQQEVFRLERERRVARKGAASGPQTGALPDFLVIGARKAGTTYLYHLLTRHPLVEPASAKELHYFDAHLDAGTEWYRQCFPAPRIKGGRRTITGEATPYMNGRHAPKRVAEVVPEARLIALLRDPVDRAYSDYQQVARKGREPRSFEEAVGLEVADPLGDGDEASGGEGEEDGAGLDGDSGHLSRSIYVDQLLRWSEYFDREQMLILKSEDFFENPRETLARAFDFLGLPAWEPETLAGTPTRRDKRNKGRYQEGMDPATRRRLEEYFEPHNRRLYEFLGVDFGW